MSDPGFVNATKGMGPEAYLKPSFVDPSVSSLDAAEATDYSPSGPFWESREGAPVHLLGLLEEAKGTSLARNPVDLWPAVMPWETEILKEIMEGESDSESELEREALAVEIERPPHLGRAEWQMLAARPRHIGLPEWRRFLRDMSWFYHHEKDLVRRGYGGRFVAVFEEKEVADDSDGTRLLDWICRTYPDESVYMNLCGADRAKRLPKIRGGPTARLL